METKEKKKQEKTGTQPAKATRRLSVLERARALKGMLEIIDRKAVMR